MTSLSWMTAVLVAASPAVGASVEGIEKVTIAAAADLRYAMPELVAAFQERNQKAQLEVIFGSSGKFQTQIQQGAPFDLFFSADIALPRALAEAGFAASDVMPYARGRLVLWSASLDARALTLERLGDEDIKRVAIASPKHAPYGRRAMEVLEARGLREKVEPKLVYAESVAQAAQFVQTGNAQVGFIALALALGPELSKHGYGLIPEALHQPLEQGLIITKRAAGSALARRFAEFVMSDAGRAILSRYGFAREAGKQQPPGQVAGEPRPRGSSATPR